MTIELTEEEKEVLEELLRRERTNCRRYQNIYNTTFIEGKRWKQCNEIIEKLSQPPPPNEIQELAEKVKALQVGFCNLRRMIEEHMETTAPF